MEYKKVALAIMKKCEADGVRIYEECMKEKDRVNDDFHRHSNFYCLNQKRIEQTFCLHEEKKKASITSGGYYTQPKTLSESSQ